MIGNICLSKALKSLIRSVCIEVDFIHSLLQLDVEIFVNFLFKLLLLLSVLVEHLEELGLLVARIRQSVLNLIVCSHPCFQLCLILFLSLYLFMNLGNLLTSLVDLSCLIAGVDDTVLDQALLECILLPL